MRTTVFYRLTQCVDCYGLSRCTNNLMLAQRSPLLFYCGLTGEWPPGQNTLVSALRQTFFDHDQMVGFWQTCCCTHGLKVSQLLLNRPMPHSIWPVCNVKAWLLHGKALCIALWYAGQEEHLFLKAGEGTCWAVIFVMCISVYILALPQFCIIAQPIELLL